MNDQVIAATTCRTALATAVPVVSLAGQSNAFASLVRAPAFRRAAAAANASPPSTALIEASY